MTEKKSFSHHSPPQLNIQVKDRLSNIQRHFNMEGSNPTLFHNGIVPQAPEDPLFGLMAAYRKDTFEKKVDLGIGAYRDNHAQPWVLPVVKKVTLIKTKTILALTIFPGRGITPPGSQAQSRVSANRWTSRVHHGSTEAHPRSRQSRHKGQAGTPRDSYPTPDLG